MKRMIEIVAGLVTVLGITGLAAPSSALAAREAVCNHPEGSRCTATLSTGRILCECLDGQYELHDPELPMADESGLMDACWEAWSQTCAPWTAESVECEEPDVGACEVTADDGGEVECTCADGSEVEESLASLEGQDEDALEDSCYEQLDRLCEPPEAEPEPESATTPFGSPAESSVSCAVDPSRRAPWLLLPLLGLGWARRRRG